MPRLVNQNPKYRKHAASGQAVVTLNGTDVYLGPHGTKTSRDEYDRVIGEWLSSGRIRIKAGCNLCLIEILAAFWKHAERRYTRPDGTVAGELNNYRWAIRPLKRLYGQTAAIDFGPKKLRALREEMIRMFERAVILIRRAELD